MKLRKIVLLVCFATSSINASAAELPHANLVAKYLASSQKPQTLPECASDPVSAPMTAGPKQECWAAFTARKLLNEAAPTRAFALDTPARQAALKQCKSYSYKQLSESAECRAAAQAESIIALRQSSIRSRGLAPLAPSDFARPNAR